jgi:hypothetical protein
VIAEYRTIKPRKLDDIELNIGDKVTGYEQSENRLVIFLPGGWWLDCRDYYVKETKQ